MSASAALLAAAAPLEVTDRDGRRLTVRRPTALDRLRLYKAAGPELIHNHAWLAIAALAAAVTTLDGVPIPAAQNEAQIEGIVQRLGNVGLDAVANVLSPSVHPAPLSPAQRTIAGN